VNKRYLWLDLPEQYANQVKSVSYTLKHWSFHHPYTTTKDEATVTATLIDPSVNHERPVTADFNCCSLDNTERPQE